MSHIIGSRIFYDGEIGTVLYAGNVGKSKGDWIGVEWDRPSRGKHSGVYDGIQYFKTSMPNAGSFLRKNKADFGVSCIVAIEERYGQAKKEDENFGISKETLILPQAPGAQTRIIEVVGMKDICETQSKFEYLRVVALREMKVSGPGPDGKLSKFAPSIVELDLSKNLLSSWKKVANIVVQLPFLKFLDLSENRLAIPDDLESLIPAFKSVRVLVLHRMNYTWQQLLKCLTVVPNVEHLSIADNEIDCLTEPHSDVLKFVKEVNIMYNKVNSWQEILKLGKLQCLESLNVCNTGLNSLKFGDVQPGNKTSYFQNLRNLSISKNNLKNWQDIAELEKLKSLNNFSIRSNPIVESSTVENIRQNIVARIGGLKILNHSEIQPVDRKGAEYEYIRRNGKEWLAAGGVMSNDQLNANFVAEHPRYSYLVSKFGAPDPELLIQKSVSLKSSLISIKIISPDLENRPCVEKKLPDSMTVQKLKGLVQRLMKHGDIKALQLSYETTMQDGNMEIPLDNDLRQLSFYSMEQQSVIIARWK